MKTGQYLLVYIDRDFEPEHPLDVPEKGLGDTHTLDQAELDFEPDDELFDNRHDALVACWNRNADAAEGDWWVVVELVKAIGTPVFVPKLSGEGGTLDGLGFEFTVRLIRPEIQEWARIDSQEIQRRAQPIADVLSQVTGHRLECRPCDPDEETRKPSFIFHLSRIGEMSLGGMVDAGEADELRLGAAAELLKWIDYLQDTRGRILSGDTPDEWIVWQDGKPFDANDEGAAKHIAAGHQRMMEIGGRGSVKCEATPPPPKFHPIGPKPKARRKKAKAK